MAKIMISPDLALYAAKTYLFKRQAHRKTREEKIVARLMERSKPGAVGRFFGRKPWSEEKARSVYRDSLAFKVIQATGTRWEREARALCKVALVAQEQGIDSVALDLELADVLVKWRAFAGDDEPTVI
ncbi:hypothetical protein KTD31_00435 [Burkholderia multivorans]|uniref:hypothetical protein n=1 Tax=Burkholderia multivorans TaxID=87883 RepID=UPI001C21DD4A|nr:hypothetical protein [Burkholderia multivorans]MBU9199866.1 hypothetical protein [Burkholderia multivorans]MDN8079015.1 hypothetical protein [Burkholderia multivorans]